MSNILRFISWGDFKVLSGYFYFKDLYTSSSTGETKCQWQLRDYDYFFFFTDFNQALFSTFYFNDIVTFHLSFQIKLLIDICNSTKGVCIAGTICCFHIQYFTQPISLSVFLTPSNLLLQDPQDHLVSEHLTVGLHLKSRHTVRLFVYWPILLLNVFSTHSEEFLLL